MKTFNCPVCKKPCEMVHSVTIKTSDNCFKVVVFSIHAPTGEILYMRNSYDEYDNLFACCAGCGTPISGDLFCDIAYNQHTPVRE